MRGVDGKHCEVFVNNGEGATFWYICEVFLLAGFYEKLLNEETLISS